MPEYQNDPVAQVEADRVRRAHAAQLLEETTQTSGEPMLRWFKFTHLSTTTLQDVSAVYARAAVDTVRMLAQQPERTVALRKLLEAKDAAVRAALTLLLLLLFVLPAAAQVPDQRKVLEEERAKLGATISAADAGAMLNRVAWRLKAQGFGLLAKPGGNRCPVPGSDVMVSCDWLVHQPTGLGCDVLVDGPDLDPPRSGPAGVNWCSPWVAFDTSRFVAPVPPASSDAIDPGQVTFTGGPADIGAWPTTTRITRVDLSMTGVHVEFDKRDGPGRWPDNTTPGWQGPLQYSLGLVLQVGGRWYASAPIEFWYGLAESGGPIQAPGQVAKNWFYDQRWGALQGVQPKAGETVGLFVVAGDARNSFNPVKERSNIVTFPLPGPGQPQSFAFDGSAPPTPPTTPPPAPVDLGPILEQLRQLAAKLDAQAVILEELRMRPVPTCPPVNVPPILFPTYGGKVLGFPVQLRPIGQ